MGVQGSVVDATIGWLVQSILSSLTDKLDVWAREVGLAADTRRLEQEMRGVEALLVTARRIGDGNLPLARSRDDLMQLLYDAEDVLDELDYYRIIHREIQQGNSAATGTSVDGSNSYSANSSFSSSTCHLARDDAKHSFTSWASKAVDFVLSHTGRKRKRAEQEPEDIIVVPLPNKHDISRRINEIASQLRMAADSVQKVLHLESSYRAATVTEHAVSNKALTTTSVPVEQKVYGRDTERDMIVKLLIDHKSNDLRVLPIVGNGGVGKTTLARCVYHDQRIKDHFGLRMWICASSDFNEVKLTREMLEQACTGRQCFYNVSSFNVLQELLIENIGNKRIMVVIDDVWEDKVKNRWRQLLAPLRCSQTNGCTILATTRSLSVAKMIETLRPFELKGLDYDEFWLLFKSCAFGDENHVDHPNLQAIGRHIAKTLKGYPLAAQSVGALLRQDLTYDHWCEIQKQWTTLQESDDSILPVLKLSYDHLSFYLQQCFSYCSLFPEDYKFDGEKLVRAWISQNFVHCKDAGKTAEETGRQYLDRLVDLCFFKKDDSYYIMHDLMHELAKMVSSNDCATIDGLTSNTMPPTIRHLSIITYAYDELRQNEFPVEKFERELQKVESLEKLRTLMFFGHGPNGCRNILQHCQTLSRYAKSMRLIRIHLAGADIDSFWETIKPFHLRFLEFSVGSKYVDNFYRYDTERALFGGDAYIKVLPTFYHLQTLDASHINLVIPGHMSNLINLRHLIAGEKTYSNISNAGKMTSLQELKEFAVKNTHGFEIGQLQSMNELVTLGISQLENVGSKEKATKARLAEKDHLKNLYLSWGGSGTSFEPIMTRVHEEVLEGLRPNRNIKHLQIRNYNGGVSPQWLGTKLSVTLLQSLHLESCSEWRIIQLERITSLRKLKLIKMWSAVDVSVPSLEELQLCELPDLERCVGAYKKELASQLRILRVESCGRLKDFTPFQSYDCFQVEQKTWFSFLNKLTIKNCPQIMQWPILPFEEMQSLEELELIGMPGVRQLSVPYLRKLVLSQLLNLERCTSQNEDRLSSSLIVLHVVKCRKLIHFPLLQDETKEWLPNIYELTVHDCPHLMVLCPLPPSAEWPKVSVSIRGVSAPPAVNMQKDWPSFTIESEELSVLDEKIVAFENLTSITNFYIVSCPHLAYVSFQALRKLIYLERMEINDCPRLLSPRMTMNEIYNENAMYLPVPFVRHLTIKSSGMMGELLLPCVRSLVLTIKECWKIPSEPSVCPLEEERRHLSLFYISSSIGSTRTTFTRNVQTLLRFPRPLYTFVKNLHISDCPELVFSNKEEWFARFTSLEVLTITGCPKLLISMVHENDTYQRFVLPASLNQFVADHLPTKLQPYFPINHTSLRRLSVWDSPRLKSLQLHYSKYLEEIEIINCKHLSTLEGLSYLNSLRILKLFRNPKLSTTAWGTNYQDHENEEDQIGDRNIFQGLQWLEIDDASLLTMSFCKHLTDLQHLTLSSTRSHNRMTRLSDEQEQALLQLTSLQELQLMCFDDLLSLPAVLHCLSSLKKLDIWYCPGISRLPEQGLPLASLDELVIRGCSEELNKQCRLASTSKLKVIIDGEAVDVLML